MKSRYVGCFIMLILLGATIGCKKNFLSPRQVDIVYNEIFWSTENDAEKGVLGLYSLYRGLNINGQMYERGDVTGGFFKRGWNGGSPDALYIPGDFENLTSNQKSWGSLESYSDWNGYYKVVSQANLVIKYLGDMPDNVFEKGHKEKLMGEALFIRALIYYDIARIWGNAPLIMEAIENSNQVINPDKTLINKERSADVDIIDSVLADANEAVELLDYGIPGSDTWGIRANKASAESLIGSASLWMYFLKNRDGLSGDSDKYLSEAIKNLENVVLYGHYSLASYDNSSSIHEIFVGQSSEAVFELNVSSNQNETYRVDNGGIEFLTCKLPPLDDDQSKDRSSSINFVPFSQKDKIYPEYPEDKRADLFFEAWTSPYEDAFSDVSQVSTDRNKVTWMTKFSNVVVDPQRQWNEYVAYFSESNIPVFRFTGIKLLLAEAYIKNKEQSKALPIINEIRLRAGLEEYTGIDYLGEVLQQRISELIGEGKLYFDFVRNNWFPSSSLMTTDRYVDKGYYWPVSNNILTTNKLIFQTSFWNGKTTW